MVGSKNVHRANTITEIQDCGETNDAFSQAPTQSSAIHEKPLSRSKTVEPPFPTVATSTRQKPPTSTLPPRTEELSPSSYFRQLLASTLPATYKLRTLPSLSLPNHFLLPTPEQISSYKSDVLSAIRSRDVDKLRSLANSGSVMQSCNQFGECPLHLACRRGFTEVVSFLLHEANVTPKVRDDTGRTPLHDACWTVRPEFEIVDMLLERAGGTEMMLMEDRRGHTPLDYVRREHWKEWRQYLRGRSWKVVGEEFWEEVGEADGGANDLDAVVGGVGKLSIQDTHRQKEVTKERSLEEKEQRRRERGGRRKESRNSCKDASLRGVA